MTHAHHVPDDAHVFMNCERGHRDAHGRAAYRLAVQAAHRVLGTGLLARYLGLSREQVDALAEPRDECPMPTELLAACAWVSMQGMQPRVPNEPDD